MITPEQTQSLSARYVFKLGWMTDLSWSPDGQRFAISTARGPVLYSMETLNQPHQFHQPEPVRAVVFDDSALYSSGDYSVVWRWDLDTLEGTIIFDQHRDQISTLAIHPPKSMFASGGKDPEVYVWTPQGVQWTLIGHEGEITFVTFNPSGTLLASAGWDKTVRVWSMTTGEIVQVLTGHTERVNEIKFSPDGNQLASASRDGTVRLWDTATWQTVQHLQAGGEAIDRVVYSPDGQLLATGGRDNMVRLWTPQTGEALATLSGHRKPITALAFNPAGTLLASCSGDHTCVLWGTGDVSI